LFIVGTLAGCIANQTPDEAAPAIPNLLKTPLLDIALITENSTEQRVRAAQLTNCWSGVNENGMGFGYCSDSFHPMQLPDGYDEITLFLYDEEADIIMQFSDDYPPYSVSVQRWDAQYAGTYSYDIYENGEPVRAGVNGFRIVDDSHDYVYEVYAKWEQGDSWYAFRVDSAKK